MEDISCSTLKKNITFECGVNFDVMCYFELQKNTASTFQISNHCLFFSFNFVFLANCDRTLPPFLSSFL